MTLFQVSIEYYGSPSFISKIAKFNHLSNPDRIYPGQALFLPEISENLSSEIKDSKPVEAVRIYQKSARSNEPPEIHLAKSLRDEGESMLSSGNARAALELLHESRTKDSSDPTAWISELRALSLLKDQARAIKLKELFLEKFPGFVSLLFLQSIAKDDEKTKKTSEQSR